MGVDNGSRAEWRRGIRYAIFLVLIIPAAGMVIYGAKFRRELLEVKSELAELKSQEKRVATERIVPRIPLPVPDTPTELAQNEDQSLDETAQLDTVSEPAVPKCSLEDFLTLIDRCGGKYYGRDNLLTLRILAGNRGFSHMLPKRGTVLYAVDQELREIGFEASHVDLWLYQHNKDRGHIDHTDRYEYRKGHRVSMTGYRESMASYDSLKRESWKVDLEECPDAIRLVLMVDPERKSGHRRLYDGWSDRRRQIFKQRILAKMRGCISDLQVDVTVGVLVHLSDGRYQ